ASDLSSRTRRGHQRSPRIPSQQVLRKNGGARVKNPGHVIIWPFHIDSTKTRGQGRKLPIARAIKQPNLREIVQAATILGYVPEPKERSAMPSLHWEKAGYVTIKKTAPNVGVLEDNPVRNIQFDLLRGQSEEDRCSSGTENSEPFFERGLRA